MTVTNHMERITAVRNAVTNADGTIDCEVQFDGAVNAQGEPDWMPYTASEHDPSQDGKQLFALLSSGKHGRVAAFLVTEEMLEAARAQKREEINAWREAQENMNHLTVFDGRRWDCGKLPLEHLELPLRMARKGELPGDYTWTDGDNNIVPVTPDELIAIGEAIELAVFNRRSEINARQLAMKSELKSLTTLIDIRFYPVTWDKEPASA